MLSRRFFAGSCIALGALTALPVFGAELTEGTDYVALNPAQPSSPDRIEVIEFFSYACSHCADMHPKIMRWAAALPADVLFVRIPVSFRRPEWGALVRTFYALHSLGELDRLDDAIFTAIHRDRQPLFNEANITRWVAQQGVSADKFRSAFNDPGTTDKSLRSDHITTSYRVGGTPTVVVAGKYAVRGRSHEQVLQNASALIEKVRAERARKK